MIFQIFALLITGYSFVDAIENGSVFNRLHSNSSNISPDLGGCSYSATCTVNGIEGVCVSTSSGCCSGTVRTACKNSFIPCMIFYTISVKGVSYSIFSPPQMTSNLCPGSSDIKCCTLNKCFTPYGNGVCEQTSKCSGKSYAGEYYFFHSHCSPILQFVSL